MDTLEYHKQRYGLLYLLFVGFIIIGTWLGLSVWQLNYYNNIYGETNGVLLNTTLSKIQCPDDLKICYHVDLSFSYSVQHKTYHNHDKIDFQKDRNGAYDFIDVYSLNQTHFTVYYYKPNPQHSSLQYQIKQDKESIVAGFLISSLLSSLCIIGLLMMLPQRIIDSFNFDNIQEKKQENDLENNQENDKLQV